MIAQPNFRSATIIHENLIAVERFKTTVKMDKPIYTGIAVFELSKLRMYQYYYDCIKKVYPGKKSELLMTDTDSFIIEIETEDLYKDMLENHEHFDFSGYSPQHPMFQGLSPEAITNLREKNKKVLGKMKDELNGDILLEFAGIRAKAYSLKWKICGGIKECQKLKGIKRGTVEKTIHHEHFLDCLNNDSTLYRHFNTFRSYNHKLQTINQNKLALTNYDDKRWIMPDGINTRAYGHYRI